MSEMVTIYMEGAAAVRTRLGMWLHLRRCEACRRYYDQVRRTVVLLGSRTPDPPPNRTEDGLLEVARGQRRGDP
jgi:predicted anti-sigma-YlaC factor YlaD